LLELALDIMDRAAQRAGQAQRLVEAQPDLRAYQTCEIGGVFPEAVMREPDFLRQRAEVGGPGQVFQSAEITIDLDHELRVRFCVALITALLKILFVAPGLEHFDRKLLAEIGNLPRAFRNRTRGVLRPASSLIDRTECEEPDQSDNADCHDLVGETNGKATHRGFLMS